jgi:hypothetical protein
MYDQSQGSSIKRIMREIIKVIPIEDYRIEITFDDGQEAIVDIKPLMKRQVFHALQDEAYFRLVKVDHKFGGLEWPNGADICIDWIEAQIEAQQKSRALYA